MPISQEDYDFVRNEVENNWDNLTATQRTKALDLMEEYQAQPVETPTGAPGVATPTALVSKQDRSNLSPETLENIDRTEAGDTKKVSPLGASRDVMNMSPIEQVKIKPEGVEQQQWDNMTFDQKVAAKAVQRQKQRDEFYEANPQFKPQLPNGATKVYPQVQPLPNGEPKPPLAPRVVHTGGPLGASSSEILGKQDPQLTNAENKMRARGIDTRTSNNNISGATLAVLNMVPAPIVRDPNNPEQVAAFADWKAKMTNTVAASLERDFGTAIPVEFDDESGNFVYLNPETQLWTNVRSSGINDEDFGAMVQDPLQTGLLAAEILASTYVGFQTGGAGLVAYEATIGAAAGSISQFLRNKRAREMGFERDLTEGVGTAGAIGAVGGAAGGGIAAKLGKDAAKTAGKGVLTQGEVLEADRLIDRSVKKELQDAQIVQETVQKEVDEGLEAIRRIRGDQGKGHVEREVAASMRHNAAERAARNPDAPVNPDIEELAEGLDATADAALPDIPKRTSTVGPGRAGSPELQQTQTDKINQTIRRLLRGNTEGTTLEEARDALLAGVKASGRNVDEYLDRAGRVLAEATEAARRAMPRSVRAVRADGPALMDSSEIGIMELARSQGILDIPQSAPDDVVLSALKGTGHPFEDVGMSAGEIFTARRDAVTMARAVMKNRDRILEGVGNKIKTATGLKEMSAASKAGDPKAAAAAVKKVQQNKAIVDKVITTKGQLRKAEELIDPASPNALTAKNLTDALFDPPRANVTPAEQEAITQTIRTMTAGGGRGEIIDNIAPAIRNEISKRIRHAFGRSPEEGSAVIQEIIENRDLMKILRRTEPSWLNYHMGLKQAKKMVDKHVVKGAEATPVVVSRPAESIGRKAMRVLSDAGSIGSILLAVKTGDFGYMYGLVAARGLRMAAKPVGSVTDETGTRILSRLYSRPDLLGPITDMKTGRAKTAGTLQLLHELGAEIALETDEPVRALTLDDGTIIPLSKPEGGVIKTASEYAKLVKDFGKWAISQTDAVRNEMAQ